MRGQIEYVLKQGRAGTKVTYNGIVYFIQYSTSIEGQTAQILTLLKKGIKKSLLTDEEMDETWPSMPAEGAITDGESLFQEIMRCARHVAQAQLDKVLKVLV